MRNPRPLPYVAVMLVMLLGAAPTAQLTGVDWVLVSYGPVNDLTEVPEEIEITARFDATEGTVTGRGGCNGYFGGFETDDDRLSISNMGFTQMMCGPEIMKHEDAFIRMFSLAERYEIAEERLTVHLVEGQVMVFKRREG